MDRKDVFTVVDRPNGDKALWVRIGAAFLNKDGSWTVRLHALPVNGMLNIRDPKPANGHEK